MPAALHVRIMSVAQLPAVGHRHHVPLLACGINWPYRPDIVYTCPTPLSQKPRVVGIFQRKYGKSMEDYKG